MPHAKLLEATADELNDLSDRVLALEATIRDAAINSGLLALAALVLFLLTGNPVTAVPALFAVYTARTLSSDIARRRSAIADIAKFEDRLSKSDFGVKWDAQGSTQRMRVRVFQRRGQQAAP